MTRSSLLFRLHQERSWAISGFSAIIEWGVATAGMPNFYGGSSAMGRV
jgi:hypothetical protein